MAVVFCMRWCILTMFLFSGPSALWIAPLKATVRCRHLRKMQSPRLLISSTNIHINISSNICTMNMAKIIKTILSPSPNPSQFSCAGFAISLPDKEKLEDWRPNAWWPQDCTQQLFLCRCHLILPSPDCVLLTLTLVQTVCVAGAHSPICCARHAEKRAREPTPTSGATAPGGRL